MMRPDDEFRAKVIALTKSTFPALRWGAITILFMLAGFGGSGVMCMLWDKHEFLFSFWSAVVTALGGGICAWLVFHIWHNSYPFPCALTMGYFSGIPGAGAFLILVHLLAAMGPIGGARSTSG